MDGYLLLEDGTLYKGKAFGFPKDVICELVLNTGSSGYTETISDPGYCGQGVVMTFPSIGNYGVARSQIQSSKLTLAALIVRDYHDGQIHSGADLTLDDWLKEEHIPGLFGVDTRALAAHLREQGSMRAQIGYGNLTDLRQQLKAIQDWQPTDQVPSVGADKVTVYPHQSEQEVCRLAVLDYGATYNFINDFTKLGATVTVLPYNASAEAVMSTDCDGIVLSNGPGDPNVSPERIAVVAKLIESEKPILAIGLGHQLLALAAGLQTEKMPFGHRGGNQPVRRTEDGKLFVSGQNHSYVVKRDSVANAQYPVQISYEHVNDQTVEGLSFVGLPIQSYQFHPETGPGPEDTFFILKDFVSSVS